MKPFLALWTLCLASTLHADSGTVCGSGTPRVCQIEITLDGKNVVATPDIAIVDLSTKVQWHYGGSGRAFLVSFPNSTIFPPQFFFGGNNGSDGSTPVKRSSGIKYKIFVIDQNGNRYFKDPKVIVNTGNLGP